MGKVTKTVVEDMAYQLKRVGLLLHAHNHGKLPEEAYVMYDGVDFDSAESILDWVIENTSEVFAEHMKDYESRKFYNSAAYKADENFEFL